MKKYHLKVLYLTSSDSSYARHQSFKEIIEADYYNLSEGVYQFIKENKLVSSYPAQCTIIEKVE